MPYAFRHQDLCPHCTLGYCVEDRRANPVRGRKTQFRLKQQVALACTFGDFVPGSESDPNPSRKFDQYLAQFRANALAAGLQLLGTEFTLNSSAVAKVEGDVFELLEAAVLWEAASVWNRFMDSGVWESTCFAEPGATAARTRKIAIVKLPRGYDATRLFIGGVRSAIASHQAALARGGMELGLSSPDIVVVRLPGGFQHDGGDFARPLGSLDPTGIARLESGYKQLEGRLEAHSLLMAIAVKRTTRSDRLYQPLFEANVLKYLIQEVLRGSTMRFHVHLGSFEGADVEGHYRAASLVSLLRGGSPSFAVDRLWLAESPQETAQMVLDELLGFP